MLKLIALFAIAGLAVVSTQAEDPAKGCARTTTKEKAADAKPEAEKTADAKPEGEKATDTTKTDTTKTDPKKPAAADVKKVDAPTPATDAPTPVTDVKKPAEVADKK